MSWPDDGGEFVVGDQVVVAMDDPEREQPCLGVDGQRSVLGAVVCVREVDEVAGRRRFCSGDREVVALATPDGEVEGVAQPDGGGYEAGGGGFRFVDGLTCAVDVGVETVLVCFCCSGVEVGDGPGPVDGVGVKSNSVTPRGSVRRDRAMAVPMWWTSRRWASFEGGGQFVCHDVFPLEGSGPCSHRQIGRNCNRLRRLLGNRSRVGANEVG